MPQAIFHLNSTEMDNVLTIKIGLFLKKEHPTDQEIIEAATILLSLDPGRERGIYNSTLRRPQSLLPWVRADLKKFYDNRKRGFDNKEAEKFNKETEKLVTETLSSVPEGVEREEADAEKPALGKRADHESLPDDIKALWDKNAKRWDKMRKLHAQLAAMISKPDYQACDGNEICYLLRQEDNALRKDYETYDSYKADDGTAHEETPEEKAARINDQINKARVYVTRTLKKEKLDEDDVDTLQDAANLIYNVGKKFKPDTIEKLKAVGVTIPENDGQGPED